MRKRALLGLAGVVAVGAGALGSSCGSTDVTCEDLATCPNPTTGVDGGTAGGQGSGGAAGAAGMGVGNGGGVGGESGDGAAGAAGGTSSDADAACTSTVPPSDGSCLNEKIAIFVSPKGNDTTGTGQRGAEYRTISAGIRAAKAALKRVYVCDDGTGYSEQLTFDAVVDAAVDGLALYGGFECATWTYATARRSKVAPPAGSALSVKGLTTGLKLADFDLVSANATAFGASSIGAELDTAMNVVLQRVRIAAGSGGTGQAGAAGLPGDDGPVATAQRQGAPAACPAAFITVPGGTWPSATLCGSKGGNGGPANMGTLGYQGLPGMPGLDNSGARGGVDGGKGVDGTAGPNGTASTVAGSFTASGYSPGPPGSDGGDGSVGQGGGGGGASDATGTCIGASGGAGGMGGCGGKKGLGGARGGASVAVLSWMSTLTLDHCELVAVNGGSGGVGGNGGNGGLGRAGAPGGAAFSSDAGDSVGKGGNGGTGGMGGPGGSGAGGNGGPSYALVYKGDLPRNLTTTSVHGNGGSSGSGGQVGTVKAPDGLVGEVANEFQVN